MYDYTAPQIPFFSAGRFAGMENMKHSHSLLELSFDLPLSGPFIRNSSSSYTHMNELLLLFLSSLAHSFVDFLLSLFSQSLVDSLDHICFPVTFIPLIELGLLFQLSFQQS